MTIALLYLLSSISVLASSMIAPAMGQISLFFHDVDPTLVKLIMTTPAIFTFFCTSFANPLAKYVGKANAIIIGLIIYAIGGVGAGLSSNIYLVLAFRAVLGMGLGIVVPVVQSLPIDLIADIYRRNRVIARQSASINAGNIVMTLVSGLLASISWRYTFFVYGVGLPIAILCYFYLPNIRIIEEKDKEFKSLQENKQDKTEDKLPKAVYTLAITMFFFFTAITFFYINIAILIQERALGGSRLASYILSFGAMGSFILAMNLQKIQAFVGESLLKIVCITTGLGFITLHYTYTQPLLFLIAILTSMGAGCVIPSTIMRVATIVKAHQSVKALAILSSCSYIGQFISPIIFDNLPILSLANDIIGGRFLTVGIIMFMTGILMFIHSSYKKNNLLAKDKQ